MCCFTLPLLPSMFIMRESYQTPYLLSRDNYHLWIDEKKYDVVMMTDDITVDLDVAMSVRRDNVVGKRTPDGILTRLAGSAFERLIQEIESRAEPATIELGMMLLRLSEDAAIKVSESIELTTERTRREGKPHNFVLRLGE